MKHLDRVEMNKKKLAMRVRARLRLEAQEAYAERLNDLLPALEAEHDQLALDGNFAELPEVFGAATAKTVKARRAA